MIALHKECSRHPHHRMNSPPLSQLPSIRQLRAFVAVYRSGSLSAAAEMLSVTQPAVTVLIRELEQRLGVRLFDRTTRRLNRTDAAVQAIGHAERVLAELQELGRSMADFAGSRCGRLRLATTATVAQTILPPLLRRFAAAYPQVELSIDDCAPAQLLERVTGEQVELAVGTLEAPVRGLGERRLLEDRIVAAAPAGPGFVAGEPMTWAELASRPVVTVKAGYGVRRQIEQAAARAGVVLRVEHEVALLTTALALAAGGLGVAVVPAALLAHGPYPQLVARPLVEPQLTRDTAVIFKLDRTLSPAARAFIELLCPP